MSLTIIVGPSCGVGKSSICRKLIETSEIQLMKTNTSRPKRTEDFDQKTTNYNFFTKEEFEKKIERNEFFEFVDILGNYYGTTYSDLEKAITSKEHFISVLDLKGCLEVQSKYSSVNTIFILPPSLEELKRRLISRNTEDKETIEARINYAINNELPFSNQTNYQVVNDCLEETVQKIKKIILKK